MKKFTFQKRSKKNVFDFHQRANLASGLNRIKSVCVSQILSMKQAAKMMHISLVLIYPLEKNLLEQAAFNATR